VGGGDLVKKLRRLRRKERGAALVEMAMVLPILLLLLLGTIEFAWVFAQNLDVRHGAREGARLLAVNYPDGPNPSTFALPTDQTDAIVAEVCSRMDVAAGATVILTNTGGVGLDATARVKAPIDTLTGFMDWAIPSSAELNSEVTIRIEQPPGWAVNGPTGDPCP
jgi:Flp pilus assembly protein TadG